MIPLKKLKELEYFQEANANLVLAFLDNDMSENELKESLNKNLDNFFKRLINL